MVSKQRYARKNVDIDSRRDGEPRERYTAPHTSLFIIMCVKIKGIMRLIQEIRTVDGFLGYSCRIFRLCLANLDHNHSILLVNFGF